MAVAMNAGITAYFLGYEKLLGNGFPRRRLVNAVPNLTSEYISKSDIRAGS